MAENMDGNRYSKQHEIHRELCEKLNANITDEELISLKRLCEGFDIGRGKLSNMKTTLDVLDALQSKGVIKVGEYNKLRDILNKMGQRALTDLLDEAEDKIAVAEREKRKHAGYPVNESIAPSKKLKTSDSGANDVYDTGKTLFVVFNQFTDERQGTIADENRLKNFFSESLGYTWMSFRDLSKTAMEKGVDKIVEEINKRKSSYKRLFITIMSHGNENGVKTCLNAKHWDHEYIKPEDIFAAFKNDRVPHFVGCPKVFFIQACRGSTPQEGVPLPDDQPTEPEEDALPYITTPVDADMLMVYSQTKGYLSYRHPNGSWFIQTLVDVCSKNYKEQHLLNMLTQVNREVSERCTTLLKKQMPCQMSTLTKHIYL